MLSQQDVQFRNW